MRGYKADRFSFNVKGGRCEACQGDGIKQIDMQFMPDVYVKCEVCHGTRYAREMQEVKFRGHSISDVLEMTVDQALDLFQNVPSIKARLRTLHDVGLGYIRLGQPSPQLSGGEAQRVKLAAELSKRDTGRTLYLLDEPTTGLHYADVERLLAVQHRLDVLKTADWLIDLGPEGGPQGGYVLAEGTPEDVAANPNSTTGRYLREPLDKARSRRPLDAAA
jgi:excinuclease ABC subunit A